MRRYCAGELAKKYDLPVGCVLRIVQEAGVRRFWCCEELFGYRELLKHRDGCPGLSSWIEFESDTDIVSVIKEV